MSTLPIVLALPRAAEGGVPGLAPLGGLSLLRRLLTALEGAGAGRPVVVTSPLAAEDVRREVADRARTITVRPGSRLDAIAEALAAHGPGSAEDTVLIHEAERALTPPAVLDAVLSAIAEGADAAAPGIAVTDSVKRRTSEGLRNVDRSALRTLQCPRAFRRSVLEHVLDARVASPHLPDDEIDAAIIQDAMVRMVPGSHHGAAVTDRLGLWQAQIALGLARDTTIRR